MAFLALGTSFCVALATLISAEVVQAAGGPLALSRWRMLAGFILLALLTTAVGGWNSLSPNQWPLIVLSSLVAIVVADPALNGAIALIGARRTGLFFALSAPFAALLGFLSLGETIGTQQLIGCTLVACGIAIAVGFNRRQADDAAATGETGSSAHTENRLSPIGASLAVIAALGQAVGILTMRPVMLEEPNAFEVMALRTLVAAVALWGIYLLTPHTWKRGIHVPAVKTLAQASLSVFIGYGVGMSMLMLALTKTNVAIASTLSSMAPVAILPMLRLRTGKRIAWQSWGGAIVTVLGTALLFWR